MRLILTGVVAVLSVVAIPASAQWITFKSPGIPRTKDGKPDLSASTPRTADGHPDLTGIWAVAFRRPAAGGRGAAPRPANPVPSGTGNGGLRNNLPPGETVPFQPWAEALYKHREETNGVGLPSEHCLPHGLGSMAVPIPFKMIQTPQQLTVLFEEFNYYRQIFTDGRSLPPVLNPSWFGYSVGKWEKDTLVVETIGYNDKTWIDMSGYPHTEDMRTIERFMRRDFGHMDVEITIDDPKAYTKPWTPTLHFDLRADFEMMEEVCDNEKDAVHMVGK
jgi:hypothetical protein